MLKIEPRTLSMLGKYSMTATSAAQEITLKGLREVGGSVYAKGLQ